MARKNEKKQIISYENSIKKSTELSMSKLNQGLTLNEMQLLAYAIYSTQKDGKTEFNKADFEKKFSLEKYQTIHAKKDAQSILNLKFSIEDIENDYFEYYNVFQSIKYDRGLFRFKWTEDMIPHILELKEKYVITDLTITSQFRSGFSWTLYEYLKANYGYWHKPLSKEALMRLFGVEDKKTYKNNTGRFKTSVLDVAIEEINQYTEFNVWYMEEKEGRAIIAFDLHWSTGEVIPSATNKQIDELITVRDAIFENLLTYVNLKDDINRQRSIELMEEVKGLSEITHEPICITNKEADLRLKKANWVLNELENLVALDKKAPVVHHNWLDK